MALFANSTSSMNPTAYINNGGSYTALNAVSASGTAVDAQSSGLNNTIQSASYGTGIAINGYKAATTTSGNVASFANNSPSNSTDAVNVLNLGTGNALTAVNTNSSTGSAGNFSNNNSSTTLNSINNGGGTAFNANAQAGSAIYANSNGSAAPTIYANNSGTGDAMQIFSATGGQRAIYASNSSPAYATIEANNAGTGNVFTGNKNTGTTSGNVASFSNASSTNSADALFVTNAGAGAAIHANSTTTSTLALWIQSGHVKSTQTTAPTTSSVSVSGGGISAAVPSLTNATDVKGKLTAVITTTNIVNPGNNTTIRVTFNKAYSIIPTVVVTPLTDMLGASYFVTNVTTTTFDLTIKNSTSGSISTPTSWTINFNYIVIE